MSSYQFRRATEILPQEIWEKIGALLPYLSPISLAQTLRISVSPNRRKHSQVWDEIFRDYRWLHEMTRLGFNPLLVGADLDELYNKSLDSIGSVQAPIYLVLLCGEDWPTRKGNRPPQISVKALEKSLKGFDSYLRVGDLGEESEEVVFHHNRNIRLHIGDFYRNPDWSRLPISRPRGLFDKSTLDCSYIYWKNDYKTLRKTTEIAGEGLNVCTSASLSEICGVTLQRPQKKHLSGDWQQIFILSANRLDIRDNMFEDVEGKSSRCIGWVRRL